jgi:hypothetical protein
VNVFSHSGDLGDMIYALATIKACGGGHLRLTPANFVHTPWTESSVALVKSFLMIQPYIMSVFYYDRPKGRNLDAWRNDTRERNIIDKCLASQRLPVPHSKPWLIVDREDHVADVVMHRNERYNAHPQMFRKAMAAYPDKVFVGTVKEHARFVREFGPIRHHPTPDILDLARVIAGCKLFVGGQSAPMAIALGLGVRTLQEVYERDPNCRIVRPLAYYWDRDRDLPRLESDTMRIAVINGFNRSPDNDKLAAITCPNKQEYCDKHGYTYIKKIEHLRDRHPVWLRLAAAREHLANFDGVWLNDLDTIILNMDVELDDFFKADFTANIDRLGFNASSIFIRNTPWAHQFLAGVWEHGREYDADKWREQTAIAMRLFMEPKDKWAVLPQRECNSYMHELYYGGRLNYPDGEYQPGDFVLHLPAIPTVTRIAVFKEMLGKHEVQSLIDEPRRAVLADMVRRTNNLIGDLAEVGVYQGGSALVMAKAMAGHKTLHLFDTFAGLPDSIPDSHHKGEFACSLKEVTRNLLGYKVQFHPGVFPATSYGSVYACVHLDGDLYRTTLDGIDFFLPRLVPGGCIVFDDYNWPSCPGVNQAIEERGLKVVETAAQQAVYFKPARTLSHV